MFLRWVGFPDLLCTAPMTFNGQKKVLQSWSLNVSEVNWVVDSASSSTAVYT